MHNVKQHILIRMYRSPPTEITSRICMVYIKNEKPTDPIVILKVFVMFCNQLVNIEYQ